MYLDTSGHHKPPTDPYSTSGHPSSVPWALLRELPRGWQASHAPRRTKGLVLRSLFLRLLVLECHYLGSWTGTPIAASPISILDI